MLDTVTIEKLKKLVIIAMFTDNILFDKLVLKGGNALDIVYGGAGRASFDFDFSMESEFGHEDLEEIEVRMENSLKSTIAEAGYMIFDFSFENVSIKNSLPGLEFWGGYTAEFKVVALESFNNYRSDMESLRKYAIPFGKRGSTRFKIDISKYEYCNPKRISDIDDYSIYVYTPEMILFEKVRAICQQHDEYRKKVYSSSGSPRGRDFFDIYYIQKNYNIKICSSDNIELMQLIFKAKKVPLELIKKISDEYDFHKQDFQVVQDTVRPSIKLKDFDYYFNYVLSELECLQTLRIV